MALFSKHYPETHRIDDWQKPWLPATVRLVNAVPESLVKRSTLLEEQRLLDRARRSTGLNDFGDNDFLEPFRLLLKDLNQYNHYTNLGRITIQTILHQQLCARLYLEDKLKRNPDILQQRVNSPLIIAGLPRTGTTHLHNLLACANSLRYMPLWQTLQPATPPPEKGRDHRRLSADLAVYCAKNFIPLLPRMHEMETDDPHEELTVCALCYRSFFFEGAFQVPNYREWYAKNTHVKGYEYLKQTLQILQTETAPGEKNADARWVLKSPQHVDQLESIVKVFPDTKILLTRRDPVRAVLSMITMMLYSSRQVYKPTRLKEEALAWADRLEQMLRSSEEQAARIPGKQLMKVSFDELMSDPREMISRISQFAEVDLDAASWLSIGAHLKSHTRDRHGKIDYRFEDIGLNENEMKERFSFYKL